MVTDESRFKLLAAPPGCGKTVVMISIILSYVARGYWVRCLVPLSQVCGDIRQKLVAGGLSAAVAAATVMTIQLFTHRQYTEPTIESGAMLSAARRLIMIDEALATSAETLDAVYYKVGGDSGSVRFSLFGDPFQMPAVGTPAAHSVMLQPTSRLRVFAFSSGVSMRAPHPVIEAIVGSLRSGAVPRVAHDLLSLWHYAGALRPVATWIVATHERVEYYNRLWQQRSGSATLTAATVPLRGGVGAQDRHPVRLCIDEGDESGSAPNVMATCNFDVVNDDGDKVRVNNRTLGRVLSWVTAGYEQNETASITCGDTALAVTVQFCDSAGASVGAPVVVSAVDVDGGRCRRLPLQGLGAFTVKVAQGISLPKTVSYGVDDTDAVDKQSFWTVGISRVLEDDPTVDLIAGTQPFGLRRIKYSVMPGVLEAEPRTAADAALRALVSGLYKGADCGGDGGGP